MPITAAEQYAIELINRARLDPLGEAARDGVDLNAGLPPGTVTSRPKQPLAPNAFLDSAAEGHSTWILDTDTFSHTGINGSQPGERMTAAGYHFTGTWFWSENLALAGLGYQITAESALDVHQSSWMNSPLHRAAMLADAIREVGYAQVVGNYRGMTASVATTDFAAVSGAVFVTGVAYNDTDHNHFYSIGEGLGGVAFSARGSAATTTAAAGGYGVRATQTGQVTVDIGPGGSIGSVILDLSAGNVKLDLVNGTSLWSSGHTTLVSGINEVGLLGVGNLNLTGNAADNLLHGNAGRNVIRANAGADWVDGAAGADRIWGGNGNDRLFGGAGKDLIYGDAGKDRLFGGGGADRLDGGAGNDVMIGGAGKDRLVGGGGADRLDGGAGNDVMIGGAGKDRLFGGGGADRLDGGAGNDAMIGGAGADSFQFFNRSGVDQVLDFNAAQGDRLALDAQLWGGAVLSGAQIVSRYGAVVNGAVEFHFVDSDALVLAHVTSLAGLAASIDVI